MTRHIQINTALWDRWIDYQAENAVWSFDELVKQLLIEHFRQADLMKESIQEQEGKKKGKKNKNV